MEAVLGAAWVGVWAELPVVASQVGDTVVETTAAARVEKTVECLEVVATAEEAEGVVVVGVMKADMMAVAMVAAGGMVDTTVVMQVAMEVEMWADAMEAAEREDKSVAGMEVDWARTVAVAAAVEAALMAMVEVVDWVQDSGAESAAAMAVMVVAAAVVTVVVEVRALGCVARVVEEGMAQEVQVTAEAPRLPNGVPRGGAERHPRMTEAAASRQGRHATTHRCDAKHLMLAAD